MDNINLIYDNVKEIKVDENEILHNQLVIKVFHMKFLYRIFLFIFKEGRNI